MPATGGPRGAGGPGNVAAPPAAAPYWRGPANAAPLPRTEPTMPRPRSAPPQLLAACALALAACSPAPAPASDPGAAAAPAGAGTATATASAARTSPDDVRALLSALADDRMEGRRTGTPGELRARPRFIAAQIRAPASRPRATAPSSSASPSRWCRAPTARRVPRAAALRGADTVPAARGAPDVNVVGVLPGTRPRRATVGARRRALRPRRHRRGGERRLRHNGADDDATGAVAVLEIARALAATPPDAASCSC